jgi:preprotein translocase subunit SecE
VNRETKRLLQRQGQMGADGTPQSTRVPQQRQRRTDIERPGLPARAGEYLREVRNELVKVAWPPRSEVINYATVVFFTLVVLVGLIFLLNYGFGHFVIWLYRTPKTS